MLTWEKAKIVDIEILSEKTSIFKIELLDKNDFDFVPGQFITIDLPIHEKRNKRLRSYSIASAPQEGNLLELIIGNVPHGLASEYFFNTDDFKVGTLLKFRGPLGVFTLPENLDRHHVFVCTGTGVAPFRSMIRHIIKNKIPFLSIDLVFGARFAEDILYQEEFEKLAQEIDNFNYHICLSRETFNGYQGYVHEKYQEVAKTHEKEKTSFLFCGWREMIDQARQELSELNYKKEQIIFELYG
jgi:CDP-4-dehydro-6-deoxyglucose reductase